MNPIHAWLGHQPLAELAVALFWLAGVGAGTAWGFHELFKWMRGEPR